MQPTAILPSAFHQRIRAQEAPGGAPVTLNIVVPSVTEPGKMFDVRVAVLDETGYPSKVEGAADSSRPLR